MMNLFLTRVEASFGIIYIVSTILDFNIGTTSVYSFVALSGLFFYGWYRGLTRMQVLFAYSFCNLAFFISYYFGDWEWTSRLCLISKFVGIWFIVQYGRYYYVEVKGPYGVGHRSLKLNGQTCPAVSIFYPMDREQYERDLEDKAPPFILEGNNGLTGLAYSFQVGNPGFFKGVMNYKLRAVDEGKLHPDFETKHKALTPVVISHGEKMNRTSYASIASNLASFGCMVYCIDHTDASCTYFKDLKQNPPQEIYFEEYSYEDHKITRDKFVEVQFAQRIVDIFCVLQMIKKEAQASDLFGSLSLDLNKLSILGHSFGADTALESCYSLSKDFKLCVALDSTFFWKWKTIKESESFAIQQPLLMLNTERFHERARGPYFNEYNPKELNDKFFEDSKKKSKSEKSYNMTILNTDHVNQTDMSLYYHNIYKMSNVMPSNIDVVKKYEETIHAVCAFFDEHDFLPVKYGKQVKEVVFDR